MSKKTMRVNVSYSYEIEIDTENSIVKDYDTEEEMIVDLAQYKFSNVLPVMKEGVKIIDSELIEWSV